MELVCASTGPSRPWTRLPGRPLSEAEDLLIQSALRGRPDAFGDLVQPYLTSLIRFTSARLGSESEAEDIVQQAALRAFSHLGQFRHEASFKTWLSAIASNEVIRWRRGQAVAPIRSLHEKYAANLADPPIRLTRSAGTEKKPSGCVKR